MHPDMAVCLVRQHHDDLIQRARQARTSAGSRGLRRRVPRWQVTWSRATLAAAGAPGRRGRSWVIIISATRGA